MRNLWRQIFCPWRRQQHFTRHSNYNVAIFMCQSLVTLAFLWRNDILERCSWFKFNNLWLVLGGLENLQQCGKCVKTKSQEVLRTISSLWRIYWEKSDRSDLFTFYLPPILNRAKYIYPKELRFEIEHQITHDTFLDLQYLT